MTVVCQKICLHSIRLYAYHGVMKQERTVGGWYEVSLSVDHPFEKALDTDCIDDTVNYAALLDIARREMATPSLLLEHVAGRILKSVFAKFPLTDEATVQVTKLNPPLGAQTKGASVTLTVRKDGRELRKKS